MKPRLQPFLCLVAMFLLAGCMKPPPAGQAQQQQASAPKLALDAPPEPLGPSCLTGNLNGCDKSRKMEQSVALMWKLHRSQMTQMSNALSALEGVLRRTDTIPTARITAPQIDTSDWTDPDVRYPAALQVRVEYARGLERMGPNTVRDMDGALAALKALDKAHKKAWKNTYKALPDDVVLPKELMQDRQYSVVNAKLGHVSYSFDVPRHLGQKYIKRDVAPWVAVASHVITKPGIRYKALGEHRKPLRPSLLVSGAGPFSIQETPAVRQKFDFTTKIKPADACKELRGELRFTRADETLPLRVVFQARDSSGGGR